MKLILFCLVAFIAISVNARLIKRQNPPGLPPKDSGSASHEKDGKCKPPRPDPHGLHSEPILGDLLLDEIFFPNPMEIFLTLEFENKSTILSKVSDSIDAIIATKSDKEEEKVLVWNLLPPIIREKLLSLVNYKSNTTLNWNDLPATIQSELNMGLAMADVSLFNLNLPDEDKQFVQSLLDLAKKLSLDTQLSVALIKDRINNLIDDHINKIIQRLDQAKSLTKENIKAYLEGLGKRVPIKDNEEIIKLLRSLFEHDDKDHHSSEEKHAKSTKHVKNLKKHATKPKKP